MKRFTSFRRSGRLVAVIATAAAILSSSCGGDSFEDYLASAKEFVARNEPAAATIQLRNALLKRPDSGEARFLLGNALLSSGDLAGAEIELGKAADAEYPKEQVAPLLARLLLIQQKPKLLVERFSSVHLDSPRAEADLQTSLSAAYEMLGNRKRSQETLDEAFKHVPDFPQALVLKSRLAARDGDLEGALALIDKALSGNPALAEAWRLKGDYLVNARAPTAEAIGAYRKALEVRKNDPGAYRGILDVLIAGQDFAGARAEIEAMHKVLPGHPETLRGDLLLAYHGKNFVRAREIGQQLLKLTPDNTQALFLAGAAEYELQSLVKAESLLGKALMQAPDLLLARRMLVQTYLRTGQPGKAIDLLSPMLQGQAGDAETLSMAGEAYLQKGDLKKAEQLFKQAARSDAAPARGKTVLAMAAIGRGNVQEGVEQLKAVAASDAGTGADVALIRIHLRRGEVDKALVAIDGFERKTAGKPYAENLRGIVLLAKNDVAGARRHFEQALSVDPAYFPAAATLSTLDLAEKKTDVAARRFDSVLAADPKNYRAAIAKAEVRERGGAPVGEIVDLLASAVKIDPDAIAPRLALVDFHIRHRDLKSAASAAEEGVTRIPGNPEILDALGRVQLLTGSTHQAVQTYLRMVERAGQSPISHLRLAEAYVAANNLAAAEASVRRAIELAPDFAPAQKRLVELLMATKRPKLAMDMARALQKTHAADPVGDLLEGDIHAADRRWDAAAKAYRSGLAKQATSDLAIRLHVALQAAGDSAGASRFAADWARGRSDDIMFITHLGDEAAVRGDYQNAGARYAEVLRYRPEDPQILNNLAWVTHKQSKSGALAYAEKAVLLDPSNPGYLDTLAAILEQENQLPRAMQVQQKAVDLAPGSPVLRLRLVKLCVKAGEKQRARSHLDLLLRHTEPFPGDSEVQPLLKQLG